MAVVVRLVEKATQEEKRRGLLSGDNRFHFSQDDLNLLPGSPLAYWLNKDAILRVSELPTLSEIAEVRQGLLTTDNETFLRYWFEINYKEIGFGITSREECIESQLSWFPITKGGAYRKWYGNHEHVVDWYGDGKRINESVKRKYPYLKGNVGLVTKVSNPYFEVPFVTWTDITSTSFGGRFVPKGFLFEKSGSAIVMNSSDYRLLISSLNSVCGSYFLSIFNPTLHFQTGDLKRVPVLTSDTADAELDAILSNARELITISKSDWDQHERSWDFKRSPLITLFDNPPTRTSSDPNFDELEWSSSRERVRQLSASFRAYQDYWKATLFGFRKMEIENNLRFIELFRLQEAVSSHVPLTEITILQDELDSTARKNEEVVFDNQEIMNQFVSYGVGCIFGRYSLDQDGLILANAGDDLDAYLSQIPKPTLRPDESGILPITDDNDFADDLPSQWRAFLRAAFGDEHYEENLRFLEDGLGKRLRQYFLKGFYDDHVKRYKKRPIYWLISSPRGTLQALIYLHRYNRDTVNRFLNDYLRPYQQKLEAKRVSAEHVLTGGESSQSEKTKAQKRIDEIRKALEELSTWERDVVRPLAEKRIELDLDDGVKVNYGKLGAILAKVKGLNG